MASNRPTSICSLIPKSEYQKNNDDYKKEKAQFFFNRGSRRYLFGDYSDAIDNLSEACKYYCEVYGDVSEELGMPYLLYAKSLIAYSSAENNAVLITPKEEDGDNSSLDESDSENDDKYKDCVCTEKDLENDMDTACEIEPLTDLERKTREYAFHTPVIMDRDKIIKTNKNKDDDKMKEGTGASCENKSKDDTVDNAKTLSGKDTDKDKKEDKEASGTSCENNSKLETEDDAETLAAKARHEEKLARPNGRPQEYYTDEERRKLKQECHLVEVKGPDAEEMKSNRELAWEVLEVAVKIFENQKERGLENLAEAHVELGNIQFEDSKWNGCRIDYGKALKIYKNLPCKNNRAVAEIQYKVGLSYLLDDDQQIKEGIESLKEAASLLKAELKKIKSKPELNNSELNNKMELEEIEGDILDKIKEMEETYAHNMAVASAIFKKAEFDAKPSSSTSSSLSLSSAAASTAAAAVTTTAAATVATATTSSSSKPTNISHLIKRKKPEEPTSSVENPSPAKRAAI